MKRYELKIPKQRAIVLADSGWFLLCLPSGHHIYKRALLTHRHTPTQRYHPHHRLYAAFPPNMCSDNSTSTDWRRGRAVATKRSQFLKESSNFCSDIDRNIYSNNYRCKILFQLNKRSFCFAINFSAQWVGIYIQFSKCVKNGRSVIQSGKHARNIRVAIEFWRRCHL